MTVFFTSDTHFGHQRVLVMSVRPFSTIEEMDGQLVVNWNKVISSQDTVYHLGDFGKLDKIDELQGRIIFLPGNYDTPEITNMIAATCEIIEPNTVITLKGNTLQLIHEPDEAQPSDNFFLFGHIHGLQMVKRNGLNVGVDCHNFCPISLDAVLFYKDAIENHYNENVFMSQLG